jgi:uncharacterized oxidoreductase
MQLTSNTILITGGGSGIGLALAERFIAMGNRVIICGRRAGTLDAVKAAHPAIETRVCDVAESADRAALTAWATSTFPALNVLVNNAGIQRRMRIASEGDWTATREEIAINLDAPIHLTTLFLPHLIRQPAAAILNVTSGLAFVPLAGTPVYSATKAALHSFTLSLRHQLRNSAVQVIEVIPPAVDTDLGGPGLHTFGVPVGEFADATMRQLTAGPHEVTYGFSEESSRASRAELDAIFQQMNTRS